MEQGDLRGDFSTMHHLLEQGENLAVITVLDRQGSTPRLPGTRMLLSSSGTAIGTIGGGSVEAKALSIARDVIQDGTSQQHTFFTDPAKDASIDMICGGSLELLVELLSSNEYNIALLQTIKQCQDMGRTVYVFTPLPSLERETERKFCLEKPLSLHGHAKIENLNSLAADIDNVCSSRVIQFENAAYLVEPCLPAEKLIIFGAGHIAREVSPLAVNLGFEVSIVDDRKEYLNSERFPEAHQLIVVESLEDCVEKLNIDRNSMLLIVTRGHYHDGVVLSQGLRTEAFYIGMIGSRHKRNILYQKILDEGCAPEQLERVSCPVGVKIGADTPEEIAVSICAELIQARAFKRGRKIR